MKVANIDNDEKLTYMQTRSCRIVHGGVSWLATAGKNVLTLGMTDPLEHWWITLTTDKGNYYVIQFYDDSVITMRRCTSARDCDLCGLHCGGRPADADIWTESKFSSQSSARLCDVVQWIKNKEFSADYSLISHNCQDLCKAIYRKF